MSDYEKRFKKTTLNLQANHTWTGTPGHKVIVLDRGAVRFDYPESWVVIPDPDSLKIHDRRPPKDDCCLAVSYLRLEPIDWSGLPLRTLIDAMNEGDERPIYQRDPITEIRFGDMDIAWREMRFIDPKEKREARSRFCLARRGVIQALITYEYWEDDAERVVPVWNTVLGTLKLNDYIADPTKGPWGRG